MARRKTIVDIPGIAQAGEMRGQVCGGVCGRAHGTKTERGYVMLTANTINRKKHLLCGFCANAQITRLTP